MRLIRSSPADTGTWVVTRNGVLEVVSSRPFLVEAAAGRIWLTPERELRDEVLDAGQRLRLPPDCKVVLSGLPTGIARLTQENDDNAAAAAMDPNA
ncbi:MAG TPA: DUF2917 domain-containing protein [Burkholderiaceae bacterium]